MKGILDMAIRYQISSWFTETSIKAQEFRELKRLDAALNELWRQIYEMLKGNAMLDTKCAWQLREEFNAFADMCEREGLKHGYYRNKTFKFRNERVEFWQERI